MLPEASRADGGRGPQVPNPAKFPQGLEPVIAHVHKAGLKFGLYTARANHTCGGYAAACLHEKVDAAQYARWKVDCASCSLCAYNVDAALCYCARDR